MTYFTNQSKDLKSNEILGILFISLYFFLLILVFCCNFLVCNVCCKKKTQNSDLLSEEEIKLITNQEDYE